MADLTPLHAAFPLDASDDSRLFFTVDTDQTLSRLLDDVPTNFISMVTLNWAVEYAQSGRVDDTLILGIRIVNGTTILAAADSGGTFQTVDANVTNTTEITTGPTAFTYVNTTADQATWNGASVELQQTINRSMGADGCRIFVDFVEFTGSFAGSETIDHTTDLRVDLFVTHTTDLNVSEFTRPTDTNDSISPSVGHKMGVDSNGTIWMVGTGTGTTPTTVRLWEGPATGPGFWQLHEFDHASGRIRDVAMAIIDDTVHIVYINHSGSTQIQYHIEWPIGGNSFTNNGSFGIGESHSDETASVNASLDMVATSDNELVVYSALFNYVNFGGSTAFRMRKRVYRSVNESFSGVGNLLQEELYGPNIFDRPFFARPALVPAGTDVYIGGGTLHSRFDSSAVEHDFHHPLGQGRSLPYMRAGASTDSGSSLLVHNGRHYTMMTANLEDFPDTYVAHGLLSGAYGGDEVIHDQIHVFLPIIQAGANRGWHLFVDHYGEVSAIAYNSTNDKWFSYVSDGMGRWYENEYISSGGVSAAYTVDRAVGTTISAWQQTSSGDWVYQGETITTWYRAHTTDVVIIEGSDAAVTHTTDLVVRNDIHGRSWAGTGSTSSGLRTWTLHNGNYYMVTAELLGKILVWESAELRNYGNLITSWHLNDISGSNGLERFGSWDAIMVSGVIHLVFLVWANSRFEVHHSEYVISTDTWTHNGAFYTGVVKDHEGSDAVYVIERSDGDLIVLFQEDGSWFYSINSGAGFATAISLSTSTGFSGAALAVDGTDTHFVVMANSSSLYHWRLDGTDVLSARQGSIASMLEGFVNFSGSAKPLVHNNIMYIPQTASADGLVVAHAATGTDAPTWTKTTVTTRKVTRVQGFVNGLNGVPTFVYMEQNTWKIWRAYLDGGAWTEEDTGQAFIPRSGQIDELSGNSDLWFTTMRTATYPDIDADGYAWLSWSFEARDFPADLNWHLLRVNLNPLVTHTTDLITVEGSQVVVHTTDLIVKLVVARTHTTDVVLSGQVEAAVSHSTDVRKVNRTGIVHTTDVHIVEILTHTTDLVIAVPAHDITATITLLFNLDVILEAGDTAPATGLGIPRQGKQGPRIYNPRHKVVKKR